MKSKVAFIIVSWNNEELLAECLESIKKQTHQNHKTILVDNGSADGSIEIARQSMPDIEIIETQKNLGFARGNNIGIQTALFDEEVGYIALINTDARIDPDWLKIIIEFSENKPSSACLQGTTLDYFDHTILDSTHIYVSRIGQAIQAGHRENFIYDLGPRKVFGVNAAACVITRKFIEAQPYKKFFDETMFMYLEDVDVAFRSTVMGWDNYLVPRARAYHMGSASSGKNPGFSLYMTYRNNLGMNIKNLPVSLLLKVIISMPRADRAAVRHLKLHGQAEHISAIIKGRLMSLLFVPIFIYKRLVLAHSRRIDNGYLWFLMKKGC